MIKLLDILSELKITPTVPTYLFLYDSTYGKKLGAVINDKYSNRDLDAKTTKGPNGINIYTPGRKYVVYPWIVYFESPDKVVIELEIEPRGARYEFDISEYNEYLENVEDTKKILSPFNPEIKEEEGYYGDNTKFILNAGVFPNHKKIYEEWKNQKSV